MLTITTSLYPGCSLIHLSKLQRTMLNRTCYSTWVKFLVLILFLVFVDDSFSLVWLTLNAPLGMMHHVLPAQLALQLQLQQLGLSLVFPFSVRLSNRSFANKGMQPRMSGQSHMPPYSHPLMGHAGGRPSMMSSPPSGPSHHPPHRGGDERRRGGGGRGGRMMGGGGHW